MDLLQNYIDDTATYENMIANTQKFEDLQVCPTNIVTVSYTHLTLPTKAKV